MAVRKLIENGTRFERWEVVELHGRSKSGDLLYLCRCNCGSMRIKTGAVLRHGASKSCGCLAAELSSKRNFRHGHASPGDLTPTYRCWLAMRARCLSPSTGNYATYGAVGIGICPRWDDFNAFLTDMGPRPSLQHSLDRYPNQKGNYEPGNCRWATWKEQNNNRRGVVLLTVDGETKSLSDWSEISGVKIKTLSVRVKAGWEPKDAVWRPVRYQAGVTPSRTAA